MSGAIWSFAQAYHPLLDLFLLNCGFAFSQYIVLRAGVFSIATAGLAAIGAYAASITATRYGVNPVMALVFAAFLGTLVALLLAIPLARLRGPYQAIGTLAFVQAVIALALFMEDTTGGAMGINNIPRYVNTWHLLAALAIVCYLLRAISSTGLGRALDATSQDEAVAGSLGVSIPAVHSLAFALSGAIAGLFGGMQAFYIYTIEPSQYGFAFLAIVLSFVILGGHKSVLGPIVGTAIMTALPEIARPLQEYRLLFTGLLLIMVIAFLPQGIVDGLKSLWRRRGGQEQSAEHKELGTDAQA